MPSNVYDQAFFERINPGAMQSAEFIVPLLIHLTHPRRVVDVGCGSGVWLSVFKRLRVDEILGIDGDYIQRTSLLIDEDEFLSTDLSQPFSLPKTFDLALCLEVVEHLHEHSARGLIQSLVRLSPLVFFSAAIPGQGGIHHVNEQWPEYWENLFAEFGYVMLDPIRPLIWQDQRVAWYYRQNCFLYVSRNLDESHILHKAVEEHPQNDMVLMHKHVLDANLSLTCSLKRILGLVVSAFLRYLKKRKD